MSTQRLHTIGFDDMGKMVLEHSLQMTINLFTIEAEKLAKNIHATSPSPELYHAHQIINTARHLRNLLRQ